MRLVRVPAVAAAVIAALGLLGLAAPRTAAAAEPPALVAIALTSITPALPAPNGTVTLAGRVTNISKERLYRLQAIFWRNQAPITTAQGLDQALGSAPTDPIGARQTQVFQDLYRPASPYLEPGASASFRIPAKIADLQLAPTDGIYLMGVHVLQNGTPIAVGRARVLVPVLAKPPQATLKMTSVVILNSRPSLVSKGLLSDDHLAEEVGPTGRLTALLGAAAAERTSFAVDPALVEDLQAMQAGYQVLGPDGRTTPGTGQAAATRWLGRFEQLKSSSDGYRLPYGSPDVAALVHAGQTSVLQAAAEAGKAVTATSRLPLLVLPGGGTADDASVAAAETLDPAAILLSDASARGAGPLLTGPGRAPIVSYTSAAFNGGGPGPEPSNTPVQLQQRLLAETWIEASTVTGQTPHGRVRVLTTAGQAAGEGATVSAPWLTRSTLSALLADRPAAWDGKFRLSDAAQAAELTPAQLRGIKKLAASQRTYADLLAGPDTTARTGEEALARAASWTWRQHDGDRQAWLTPQQDAFDNLLSNGVVISSTRKVSTVARQGVEFPITIKNTLPAGTGPSGRDTNAVKVKLTFVSDNPQRLSIKTIDPPLIRAQENFTGNAEVRARANGVVPVVAQLITDSGRKVGRPVTIDVQVTQNGTTGWAIVLASGIVLAGSTALRIRQVARERAKTAPAAEGTVSGLTSAPPSDQAAFQPSQETLDV